MTIRLYTEDKNRSLVKELVGEHFDGFSLIPCEGVWKGASEDGLIVEIVTTQRGAIASANKVARLIKQRNNQEAVLVVVTKSHGKLI